LEAGYQKYREYWPPYPYPYPSPDFPTGKFRADLYQGENLEYYLGSFEESIINHYWEYGGPQDFPNLVDHFSIRWQGRFWFSPDWYRFTTVSDDGVRLFVDERRVIDDWDYDSTRTNYSSPIYLDGYHLLRLEYFEYVGRSRIQLSWREY